MNADVYDILYSNAICFLFLIAIDVIIIAKQITARSPPRNPAPIVPVVINVPI